MNETFEQFKERLANTEKTKEYVMGQTHMGNTRAVFEFDQYRCYLESFGFHTIPGLDKRRTNVSPAEMMWLATGTPHSRWLVGDWVEGKKNAERLAKQYGGFAEEDDYHEDDMDVWYLVFPDGEDMAGFDNLVKFLWDHKTGKLPGSLPWLEGLKGNDNEHPAEVAVV